ncbi:GTP cyclohydrolase [Heyndrickxia sporothermodurans]|uniref:GTP cyclohydrolase II n=1 Tax=Heyndrickxia TaxID=2837504 RepID=UPI000D333B08|nr:GTP cyclohydrolase II [Heyndrickxia sporothermodurans]PTY78006.1 GTP cyclohydrolase [Heyndrickxia sporothermodurans]
MISTDVKHLLIDKMTMISEPDKKDICLVGPINLPVKLDDQIFHFHWYTWITLNNNETKEEILDSLTTYDFASLQQSSVLVYGNMKEADNPFVRMHSICHTGDIFGSQRCDCGYQLRQSMKMIVENKSGALFYLANHEGRGIGLFSKSLAYLLQQEGFDTVEANLALGFSDDSRSYEEAIRVLQTLRSKPVTLITNNPKKLAALKKSGLLADHHIPLWGGKSDYNQFYLETKVNKSGHIAESIVSVNN